MIDELTGLSTAPIIMGASSRRSNRSAGPGLAVTMSAVAVRIVCRSCSVRRSSIACASHSLRASRLPLSALRPASVSATSCRLPSVGSGVRVTRPSSSRDAIVVAIDCGRTPSSSASRDAVLPSPLPMRARADDCCALSPADSVATSLNRRRSRAKATRRSRAARTEDDDGSVISTV